MALVEVTGKRLAAASEACGVPPDILRSYVNLDTEGRPHRLRPRCEEIARIWTAKEFHITRHTVENILAGQHRSRK